ncbi:MAG: MCE family protein [Planctomycetes bacterium]|nr:MCE family protein [Planctomycetota bacterium]MBL7007781.1 MCE family protein [Planctomycetota bacterium]
MNSHENRFRDFLLGLFFFGTVAALIYYTVILTGFSFGEKSYLEVSFPNANGLKEGDAVLVSGHHAGTVRTVQFRDDFPLEERILVSMELDGPLRLRQGYLIVISEFTMLGGRVIQIEPGVFGVPELPQGTPLRGTVGFSALATLGEFVGENREDARAMLANFRKLSDDLAAGRGLLGSLIADEAMRDDLADVLSKAQAIMDDVSAGRGALGMLVEDEVVRDRIVNLISDGAVAMIDLRQIAEDLSAGRGTFGALIADESMREDMVELAANLRLGSSQLRAMLEDAAAGKGLLGKVITDDAVADDAAEFLENLTRMTRDLRNGEGTVGKLLAEEEAYEQIMIALRTLNAQLEDAREAQPVSTFAQMLFGTTVGK